MALTFKILFFSQLQQITGTSEIERSFEAEERGSFGVGDLLEALFAEWPGLKEWDGKIRVAVNYEYVDRDHPLDGGDEIALMPPVQGG